MARIEAVHVKKCGKCGVIATVEVIDKKNNSHGYFCRMHGKRKLAELKADELQVDLDRVVRPPIQSKGG